MTDRRTDGRATAKFSGLAATEQIS